ncbi:MAG: response regulator transcription factor [Gammaproteobacteria bacterium]|nr:response regulator transcription factor [Gammaproteobacteria bacterium]
MHDAVIHVAEDNPRDREFLEQTLSGLTIVFHREGQSALSALRGCANICLLTDIQMPDLNGLALAKKLWQVQPSARIVFWSNHADESYLRELQKIVPEQTVYGYVLKNNTSVELGKAIKAVFVDDQCWIDPMIKPVQARLTTRMDALTDVEYEALIDMALGLTDNGIARRRYLSRRGVQNRLAAIYQKLNANDESVTPEWINPRVRAVKQAIERGLLNDEILRQADEALQHWLAQQIHT